MTKRCLRHTLMAILFGAVLSGELGAQETMRLAGVEASADSAAGAAVLEEGYRRIGMSIEIEWLSPVEALEAANSGSLDGDLQRIDGLSRTFTSLVQVQIPINFLEAAAFSKEHRFTASGWASLEGYSVGYVRGIVFAEQRADGLDAVAAQDYESLWDMLETGDVDVALMPRISGRVMAAERTSEIVDMEGVLEILFLYHYLHERHASLVPRLEAELKAMLLDGTTRRLRDAAYRRLLEDDR